MKKGDLGESDATMSFHGKVNPLKKMKPVHHNVLHIILKRNF